MTPVVKRILIVIVSAMAAAALSGCLSVAADELYRLPQTSDEYLRLQEQINSVLNTGAEFSPPTGGPNRQAVQLKDLNGDGTNEVIAFFSTLGDSTLKIYIFSMTDGDYTIAEVIEGFGTAFESVRFADMDDDGNMEIIVGWQMSAALKHVSIYSIKDFNSVLLAGRDYSDIAIYDMQENGGESVLVFRLPTQETAAVAEILSLMPDGEVVSSEARLSNGIETITRVLTGRLIDGVPAVFVESEGRFDDGSIVTDICVYRNGDFTNVSIREPGGVSSDTVRTRISSSDVNRDGIIKVPMPLRLPAQSETIYYAIDWYAYNSSGHSALALTTYHNYTDEWFLILPINWRGKISVRREDNVSAERTVIFSHAEREEGPYEDFLAIHKITGELREERAAQNGRKRLVSDGASVFAFEILGGRNSFGASLDEALIRDNFGLIHSDWLTVEN